MKERIQMKPVFLLRHAESAPDRRIQESEWPLSVEGERQRQELSEGLLGLGIDRIVSSPYKRAMATVELFAEGADLKVEVLSDLRERKLRESYIENWQEVLERSWRDWKFALPNSESGVECQNRMKGCVDGVVAEGKGRCILVRSPGNAIGLYLNALNPSFGFEAWGKMRNPDLFKIVYENGAPMRDQRFVYL